MLKQTQDPNVLKSRNGGGCVSVFGLPFLGVGLFVMFVLPSGLIPVEGDAPPLAFILLFGGIFAAVGTGLVFGRSGVVVDRRNGTVLKWYGLLAPMIRKEFRIHGYDTVGVTKERRQSKNSSYDVYPIKLRGQNYPDILIEEPREYEEARSSSEALARLLHLTVADSSSGAEVVRDPDRLDESVRDQTRRAGERISLADAPLQMKCYVSEQMEGLCVEIPPAGIHGLHFLMLGFGGLITVIIGASMGGEVIRGFRAAQSDPFELIFPCVMLAIMCIPIIGILGAVIGQSRKRYTVMASRAMLRVETRTLLGKKIVEIPGPELEEFEISGSTPLSMIGADGADSPEVQEYMRHGSGQDDRNAEKVLNLVMRFLPGAYITARSDRTTLNFGQGLAQKELLYIHSLIKKRLVE